MDNRDFSKKIVAWYQENRRSLPWRDISDPYRIWLSEVILQQTRVQQGLPYYERFVRAYPTVGLLAKAPEQEVLRLWQGLGYYSRARNLHRCARFIDQELNGVFPPDFAGLRKLPGVGDYTAAAIASFAYGEKVAVLDGNVFRILSRIFGIETAINSTAGKKEFATLADKLVPQKFPDQHNQAMMEFGATWCTPRNPKCENCIFQNSCFAFRNELVDKLPVKTKLKKRKSRYFYYLVFRHRGKLLMGQRMQRDIWQGLYDFPLIEKTKAAKTPSILKELNGLTAHAQRAKQIRTTKAYKHILTHQTIFSTFIVIDVDGRAPLHDGYQFYDLNRVNALPKPVLISKFLDEEYLS